MATSAIPAMPAKRSTLAEVIGRYSLGEDDSVFFELMQDVEKIVAESVGFRHAAQATQNRQDRHLREYRQFIRTYRKLPVTAGDAEVDNTAFPESQDKLAADMNRFVVARWMLSNGNVGGLGDAPHMKYQSLTQYRDSMLFWAHRTYVLRNVEPPKSAVLFNKITEAMRFVTSKIKVKSRRTIREGLGLAELRQLLDWEMNTSMYVEYSEQHQVIWCIARQTAVRPGSIGYPRTRKDDFLRWEDISFINKGNGRFTCVIRIHNLKTNLDDPEAGDARTLECYLDSPNEDNIVFSVPHRLLVIAIRRDLLNGINSIESLMQSELAHITIKRDHLRDPVFIAGLPGGRGLAKAGRGEAPPAMRAEALSAYVADRARQVGYTSRVTMYSFRRRAATDLVARIGLDATREIMGHAPGTQTLERYYMNLRPFTDLTSATLGQPVGPSGINAELAATHAPIADAALPQATLRHIRGQALDHLVDELMANDDKRPAMTDVKAMKTYLRRVRGYALRVLTQQEAEKQHETITMGERQERRAQLVQRAAQFADAVHKRAREALAAGGAFDDHALQRDHNVDLDKDFAEGTEDPDVIHEADAEEDAENPAIAAEEGVVRYTATGEEFATTSGDQNLPYSSIATSFMDILEGNLMSEGKPWATSNTTHCPLCQDDATVPESTAAKKWASRAALKDHMEGGQYHAPIGRWQRQITMEAHTRKEADPEVKSSFKCPYSYGDEEEHSYSAMNHLMRHIRRSLDKSSDPSQTAHFEAMVADGWLEPGFEGVQHARSKDDAARVNFKLLQDANIVPKKRVRHSARPHPKKPHVYLGDMGSSFNPSSPTPERFERVVKGGDHPEVKARGLDPPTHVKLRVEGGNHPNARKFRQPIARFAPLHQAAEKTAQREYEGHQDLPGDAPSAEEIIDIGSSSEDDGEEIDTDIE